eukprot:GDKH01013068.1.p1 GENE.GDKH01013068.1~~GDKH01013068.1.p1  ORF type:complete len:160 (+),score=16.70 GDKH01013068.1:115-594(+)
MSVTGASYNINALAKLNQLELEHGVNEEASWHRTYKDSAYVFIGGLNYQLTEGDIIVVFSQWGQPVDVHLIRDKSTGKSQGFCFLAYEDQRSTVLAVDNANGMTLVGRRIRVNHVNNYRAPKVFDETELDEEGNPKRLQYEATGAEGKGIGVHASKKAK